MGTRQYLGEWKKTKDDRFGKKIFGETDWTSYKDVRFLSFLYTPSFHTSSDPQQESFLFVCVSTITVFSHSFSVCADDLVWCGVDQEARTELWQRPDCIGNEAINFQEQGRIRSQQRAGHSASLGRHLCRLVSSAQFAPTPVLPPSFGKTPLWTAEPCSSFFRQVPVH